MKIEDIEDQERSLMFVVNSATISMGMTFLLGCLVAIGLSFWRTTPIGAAISAMIPGGAAVYVVLLFRKSRGLMTLRK